MISNSSTWPEVVLGEVCEFKYGKSLPESKRVVGKVAVYGSNGIIGQHNEAITDGLTIVVGRKGSFGEVNLSYDSCWPIDTTYYIDRTATNADLRWLDVCFVSPAPVERHACARRHPVPRALTPGFPLPRE